MSASTFPAALSALRTTHAARPLVTFYDDATGERIELSVATYANWVDKTAGLMQDELDLERGATVLVDLPTHWLGGVWLGAAWTLGLRVSTEADPDVEYDLVVCGPAGLDRYAAHAADRPLVACSLRPLGARFAEPLPADVVDYGAVVLAQPDVFFTHDPVIPTDAAWCDGGQIRTQQELLGAVADEPLVAPGGRLLTDANPCSAHGVGTLVSPLLEQGSVVWVANPAHDRWGARYAEERATAELRA